MRGSDHRARPIERNSPHLVAAVGLDHRQPVAHTTKKNSSLQAASTNFRRHKDKKRWRNFSICYFMFERWCFVKFHIVTVQPCCLIFVLYFSFSFSEGLQSTDSCKTTLGECLEGNEIRRPRRMQERKKKEETPLWTTLWLRCSDV